MTTSEVWTYQSYEAMMEDLERRGLGDGLPVVPASPQRVGEFIASSGRDADEVIGKIPPAWAPVTIEKIAINSAMAGCRPEYMPVVVAAVEAMMDDRFNLIGVQATTAPHSPMILVSGPIADRIKMNSRSGAFGGGSRANSTIGRAIRLLMINLGGAAPGVGDMSTQGQPSKFSYCFAENEADSPWEPYRVSLGYSPDESIVTVAALENPHNIHDSASYTAEDLLTTVCAAMVGGGTNSVYLGTSEQFLFLSPEHAAVIANDGFSRRDIQEFIFQHARLPSAMIGKAQFDFLRYHHSQKPYYHSLGLDAQRLDRIPIITCPEDLGVLVVGGPGKQSAFGPPTGQLSRPAWRRIPG